MVAFLLVLLLAILAPCLSAADAQVIDTHWPDLRQRLAPAESQGKAFRVVLLDGRAFRATLVRIEGDGLVVRTSPVTSQWAIGAAEVKIPRPDVVAIQQKGRRGHGRLIGTLVGVALMAIAVADPGKRVDTLEEKRFTRKEAAAIGALFIPLGYVIGYGVDKPYPEFRPKP